MTQQQPSIRELIRGVQRQMRIDFEQRTAQIPHPGEKGRGREDVVRSFLREYLPKRFEVGSGFIVDASGGVSRQIDIVLYDKLSAPVFPVTETQRFFPAECVAGAVSIKSSLDRRALEDAVENLISVAQLNRFASGRTEVVFGGVPSPFEHSAFRGYPAEPIFTAVWAFDSPGVDTVARNLHELIQDLEPFHRTQLIGVLNRGVVTYLDKGIIQPTYSTTAKVAFVPNADSVLPLFYMFLTNGVIRKMPLSISLRAYLEEFVVNAGSVE